MGLLSIAIVSQHQGEKDIKGPGDFSGSGAKFDDIGDADEDVVDEEEEPVKSGKRKAAGKSNVPSDATSNDVCALLFVFLLCFLKALGREITSLLLVAVMETLCHTVHHRPWVGSTKETVELARYFQFPTTECPA